MKNILFYLLSCFLISFSWAQEKDVSLVLGDEFYELHDAYVPHIIKATSSAVYVYKPNSKVLYARGGYSQITKPPKGDAYLKKFDGNLNLVKDIQPKHKSNFWKEEILDIIAVGEKMYIFSFVNDSKKKAYRIQYRPVDLADLSFPDLGTSIAEIDKKLNILDPYETLTISHSRDSSKILVWFKNNIGPEGHTFYEAHCFDQQMNLLWEHRSRDSLFKEINHLRSEITNDGDIIHLGQINKSKGHVYTRIWRAVVHSHTQKKDFLIPLDAFMLADDEEEEMEPKPKYCVDVKVINQPNGDWALVGEYGEGNVWSKKGIQGAFYMPLDLENGEPLYPLFTPFFTKKTKGNAKINWESIFEDPEDKLNLIINKVINLTNDGLVLICDWDISSINSWTYGEISTRKDILIFWISPDGELEKIDRIPKHISGTYMRNHIYLDFVTFISPNSIELIFNSSLEQSQASVGSSPEKIKLDGHYKKGRIVQQATYGKGGAINSEVLCDLKGIKMDLVAENAIQLSKKELLFFMYDGRMMRLAKYIKN